MTAYQRFDVVVVGGGPAGVTAALRARELGAEVALVERDQLGGTCTNDGCVPTRVLAHAARLRRDAAQYPDYGLQGAVPDLDFGRLIARTQEIVYRVHEKKQLRGHLERAGVAVLAEAGAAQFTDPYTLRLGDGRPLSSERFILCVGGHPRRLAFPGSDLALTHGDVWRMTRLPESVVIIGAAATGCQLASVFADFGSEVTLLEVAPRILPGEDADVAEALAAAFAARGITIVPGIGGVAEIVAAGARRRLTYLREGRPVQVAAEVVILAVGWPGNADTLNLAAAGVESARGWITVDDSLRTTAPHIFAAGDITGRMMLVQSAGGEGAVAAENAVRGTERQYVHRVVPHGSFTDPEYASVGVTEAAPPSGACVVARVPYADLDRAVIDGHPGGFCKLIVDRASRQLLGAHVVGEQAVEVVQIAAAAMAAGTPVDLLADLELSYPTYTAIAGLAARQAVHALDAARLPAQWRGLAQAGPAEWEHGES